MYALRSPITKLTICKVIPQGRPILNSPVVCPLCRLPRIPATAMETSTSRLQSTNTKTSIARLQHKKKKKKTKAGEYSELIQVKTASGGKVKESRAVIKKSTTSEILKSLGVASLKIIQKQASVISAASPGMVKKNNASKAIVSAHLQALSKLKPANRAQPSSKKCVNAVETVKKLPKKSAGGAASRPPSPKSAGPAKVPNYSSAICDRLDDVAVVDDFTMDHSYNLENIRVSSSESVCQGWDNSMKFLPNLDLDVDEMSEAYEIANSKNTNSTESRRSPPNKETALEQKEKLFKIKKDHLKKSGKEMHLYLSLSAFLDVCVNSDKLGLAHSTLMQHMSRGTVAKDSSKATDLKLFNIVLAGRAKEGHWSKMRELLAIMRHHDIQPNLQSYAACLECISRLPSRDKKAIRNVLQEVEKHGLDITKLDHECTYINDQRERIIEVIRLVHPEFQLASKENLRHYSCNLLSPLNEEPPKDRFYDPLGGTVSYEQLLTNLKQQMETEQSNKVEVRSIERAANQSDENLEKLKSILCECEKNWRATLLQAYERNIGAINSHQRGNNYDRSTNLLPFLTVLNAEVYVDIMLQEIQMLAKSESYSITLSSLYQIIGSKVMHSYIIAMKQKQGLVSKIEFLHQKYCKYHVNPELTSRYTPREYWQKLTNENMEGPSIDVYHKSWPDNVIAGIGKFLYDMIMQEVKVKSNLLNPESSHGISPAFYCIFRNYGFKTQEEIKPHPILVQLYELETKERLTFEGTVVPTLVPPMPWTSIRSGGYLLASVKIVRLPNTACHQKIKLEQTPDQQLFPLYDSLNQLGECPWKINKEILDIIIDVFNNKGDESLDIPPPPSECPPLPSITPEMTKEAKTKAYKERTELRRKRKEMHSLRCDALYKLSIANHFRDKIFWFPYNIDFRGRVYPCPPHFNHLGGDVSRGILLFAKGEPLGEDGLDWLKIHLINLTGLKKQEDIQQRLELANEMMPEVFDSADNPLNGRRWWTQSDEPWQTLACCKEIANAIRSPDPKKYVCHFPVHQDGSCNGWQHYAALGRDSHGAKQVNLYPMDKPQDVYNGIAKLVEEERAKDAKNGEAIAKILEGFIKRKVIKQTVMTTVYGVTRFGAHQQINNQLLDIREFPKEHAWKASVYLTKKTFQSLEKMFTATKDIQDWFTESAKLIAKVCGQQVEWVTPLGLPIIQPYHKPVRMTTQLGLGDKRKTGSHYKMDIFLRPDVMKQKNAFPPNFVHSLDSAHMMLTSLFCQRKGITFVSVHDCYWTHPSKNVNIMNMICRDQFVALHSEPILENLSKYLTKQYSYHDNEFDNDGSVNDLAKRRFNRLVASVPATGAFDLKHVLKSTYFFS